MPAAAIVGGAREGPEPRRDPPGQGGPAAAPSQGSSSPPATAPLGDGAGKFGPRFRALQSFNGI